MNSRFDAFLGHMRGRRVAIVGAGVSNMPLLRLLAGAGAQISVHDRGDISLPELPGITLHTGPGYLDEIDAEYIFRSPGVKPFEPQLQAAVARGCVMTSEMDVFMQVCPCPIYAVTGSDGKTTTTTILKLLLETTGRRVFAGGNIGVPLLDKAGQMAHDDIVVLELSSFQLMTMKYSPHVAVITNITPNHLDWHRGMEEYITAKSNIFRHQNTGDRVILNYDSAPLRELASRFSLWPYYFSRSKSFRDGVWIDGETIMRDSVPVMRISDILIPGAHNVENYMAAVAAAGPAVKPQSILEVAKNFTGVEHRLELVAEIGGVRYINDSIASSPTRTLAGLRVFGRKVLLIAGGRPKVPFTELEAVIGDYAKAVLLVGQAAPRLRESFEGKTGLFDCGTVDNAVRRAAEMAVPGDIVLLSPACTSFDQFKNFEERGALFKKTVMELKV
ncbi:MAG: UDP-N-acetylmuramoyl-L-alanine--D-glutamate ligase [Oscillospiraceae bacterium]|nr:UDP-N-acetylmuramoyl-L-alanine--D-glutamate ligase [Oscillospiraceae bacterium]